MKTKKFDYNESTERPDSDEPLEISSKKPAKPMIIFKPLVKKLRDPRFEESSGEFNKFIFKDHYAPLLKESREAELNELKKLEKKEKNPERAAEIKSLIRRTKNKIKTVEESEKERQLVQKLKSEKRKELKKSSGPIYVTKATLTKAQLVEKFKKLKQSGKLTKYIEKKRKKNITRDRIKLNRKS